MIQLTSQLAVDQLTQLINMGNASFARLIPTPALTRQGARLTVAMPRETISLSKAGVWNALQSIEKTKRGLDASRINAIPRRRFIHQLASVSLLSWKR